VARVLKILPNSLQLVKEFHLIPILSLHLVKLQFINPSQGRFRPLFKLNQKLRRFYLESEFEAAVLLRSLQLVYLFKMQILAQNH